MPNWRTVSIHVFKTGAWSLKWLTWEKFFYLNKKDFDAKHYRDAIHAIITLLLSQRLTKKSFKPKYMKSAANKQAQEWETQE